SKSRRTLPTQRSAIPFCQGLRNAVRIGWLPIAFTVATTSALNLASRSKIRKGCGGWLYSQVSCNCRATQSALGLRVTLQCRIRRRWWPITKKQYRMPKVRVGTVKSPSLRSPRDDYEEKSASAWRDREVLGPAEPSAKPLVPIDRSRA